MMLNKNTNIENKEFGETRKIAKIFEEHIRSFFCDGASGIDVSVTEPAKWCRVEFVAYEFLICGVVYRNGDVTPCVLLGNRLVNIESLKVSYSNIDIEDWLRRLDENIRLRIPEKYLKSERWKGNAEI